MCSVSSGSGMVGVGSVCRVCVHGGAGWADIGCFSSFVPGLLRSMPDMPRFKVNPCRLHRTACHRDESSVRNVQSVDQRVRQSTVSPSSLPWCLLCVVCADSGMSRSVAK